MSNVRTYSQEQLYIKYISFHNISNTVLQLISCPHYSKAKTKEMIMSNELKNTLLFLSKIEQNVSSGSIIYITCKKHDIQTHVFLHIDSRTQIT